MAEQSVVNAVRRFMRLANEAGINIERAILYGSHARGEANKWSDIDLIVISPEFEGGPDRRLIHKLWELSGLIDSRIEPVLCGEREWLEDDAQPILEIARQEGIVIRP